MLKYQTLLNYVPMIKFPYQGILNIHVLSIYKIIEGIIMQELMFL